MEVKKLAKNHQTHVFIYFITIQQVINTGNGYRKAYFFQ